VEAVREKAIGETVSKVLYPNDKTETGKELRLMQQYFFVACSLRDIIRPPFPQPGQQLEEFRRQGRGCSSTTPIPPSRSVNSPASDRRAQPDPRGRWEIVVPTFGYTNHTLLPEALEKWSVGLFERVLPRHLQLIYDINAQLLKAVEAKWPGDNEKKRICSLIEENGHRQVRMANLGRRRVARRQRCGRAAHRPAEEEPLPRIRRALPGKFQNKTNGINAPPLAAQGQPRLSALITKKLGFIAWVRDLDLLRGWRSSRRCRLPEGIHGHQAGQQGGPAAVIKGRVRRRRVARCAFRRPDQAPARIQAPAPEICSTSSRSYRRLLQNPGWTSCRASSSSVPSRARLRPGEEHHPRHQRRRRPHQHRPPHRRETQGRLPAELPRVARREDHPGGRLSEQISTAAGGLGTGNMKLSLKRGA